MMLLTTQNYLKHIATPKDAISLKPVRLGCPLCKRAHGPKRCFKNLWRAYYHFKTNHFDNAADEKKSREYVGIVYHLIKEGVLL